MCSFRSIVATAMTLGCVAFAATAIAQIGEEAERHSRKARFLEIANVNGYAGFFNLGQGTVRMMAILSPSCDECVAVFHEIRRVMETIPTKRLRSYVVFVPAGDDDTHALALQLASEMKQRRASHFWDPTLSVANAYKSLTDDGEAAMSGCFVFDTNAVMRDAPDDPALTMYPHAHDEDLRFDGKRLEAIAGELLARFEAGQRRGPAIDVE